MQLFFRQVGDGHPLIILHGLFGSCDNWLTISKPIAENGFSVYAIDQRNHGRSPHAPTHTYPDMADDLYEFIQQQNLQKPILVGHSMGGKTVMQFAMRYPDLAASLVVVDIAPKAYRVHHREILDGLAAVPLAQIQHRNEAEDVLKQYEELPAVRQFLLKNLYRNEAGAFDWRINLKVLDESIEIIGGDVEDKKVVETPTLFMRGALSNYVRETDLPSIGEWFPHAELDTIANAGHWVQAEQPQAFLDSLMRFLKK
ncbi:MAG: alpha/beta fold hydrolase [Spirosomaceae bacterium]|nr:alpha/beta fold hydrolase [Spirosomataceae bacterium]